MLLFVLVAAGCSDDGGGSKIDAGARPDALPMCPPQSAPLAAGMHDLYLAFEGVTLTLGDCDDAQTNCSSLVAQASTPVPMFLASEGSRATRITTIKNMVQDALAPFSVDVVTTRPSAGDYRMVVVGGTSDTITGVTGALFAAKPVCDAMNKNSIALVFEQDVETTDRAYANTIAGAFGSLAGLSEAQAGNDCMCLGTSCVHASVCTWGTGVATKPGNSCSRMTQNEHLLLIDAVGCR
jgi:hypothetical protein